MTNESSRSEQVVEDYKKRKLAISAFHKIQELILGFDQEREADARLARFGLVLIIAIIAVAVYFYLSLDQVTISWFSSGPVQI